MGCYSLSSPTASRMIDTRLKDKDGGWVAVNKNPIFYGYNSDQVQLIDVPRLATHFLRPSFKGKHITGYPAGNDATLFAYATIVRKYGWGYMTQYMKQEPKFVQGHIKPARSLDFGREPREFRCQM